MNSDANNAMSSKCCGSCSKTIRMREETKVVLCTAILDVVEADFAEVCEHYEERPESFDPSAQERF